MAAFEWDPAKAAENERKHRVAFPEAATVFDDSMAMVRDDEWHSEDEDRFHATGRSAAYRLLTVTYTMRRENSRIISARPATPAEADEYERNAET